MSKVIEEVNTNIGLEQLIRKVDYVKLQNNYFPSEFALKFINFIKLVNGEEGEENESPLFHYKILDSVHNHNNTLIVSFRGSSKTTLCAEYMILYIATFGSLDGFGKINVGMYVGDTMENGVKNLRKNLEFRYNNSSFLKQFIPKVNFTDVSWEFENIDKHQTFFKGFGATTGVRGFKQYGQRPKIAILDDLLSDQSAESPTITNSIENIIYKAVRQALHPTKRKVIWIGTPFNKKDPLYKAANTPKWHTEVFPLCSKFPCTKAEYIGAWEDRFPYTFAKSEYDMLKDSGKVHAFNQELMLRIISDEDRLVKDEDVIWYNRNEVLNRKQDYNWYMTTDFATSETQRSDYSVISIWALDYKGIWYWVDGKVVRQDMALNIDDIFNFVNIYSPLETGVEISGQQKGFVSWLKREMTTRGIYFSLANDKNTREEGLRPNTSKLVRFNVALPLFKQRKIAFPEELKESDIFIEAMDELTNVTSSGFKSIHDDFVDTISQLPLLNYFLPMDPKYNTAETDVSFNQSKYFYIKPKKEDGNSYIV